MRAIIGLALLVLAAPSLGDGRPKPGTWFYTHKSYGDIALVRIMSRSPGAVIRLTTSGYLGRVSIKKSSTNLLKTSYRDNILTVYDGRFSPMMTLRLDDSGRHLTGKMTDAYGGGAVELSYRGPIEHTEDLYQLCMTAGSYQCRNVGQGQTCGYPYIRQSKSSFLNQDRCEHRLEMAVMGSGHKAPDEELPKAGWRVGRKCDEWWMSGSNLVGDEPVPIRLINDTPKTLRLAYITPNEDARPFYQQGPGGYWSISSYKRGAKFFVLDTERRECIDIWKIPRRAEANSTYRLSEILR